MKSLLPILSALLDDASIYLDADTSHDWKTIQTRHKHEGDGFLYITLPTFGQWLEESLEAGVVQASIYPTFRPRPKSVGRVLPRFLRGLTRLVFDEISGLVRDYPDPVAVFFIRQICYLYKKPKVLASYERDVKAHAQYEQTDSEVLSHSDVIDAMPIHVSIAAEVLLSGFDYRYSSSSALPKHGPGATADGFRSNAKFTCRDWLTRWDNVFFREDIYGYTVSTEEDLVEVSPEMERPVKVISVPKTYKTTRIISVEPTAMQFAQQYVAGKMISAIESSRLGRSIRLRDQSINRRRAFIGSTSSGGLATIDLSEASDRVSLGLVKEIFSTCPVLLEHLIATRSTRAMLRDGRVISLRKFASMGSATIFPVESVIFAIVAIAAVAYDRLTAGGNGDYRSIVKESADLVSVYGDDIVVPNTSFRTTCQYLEALGLKVNRRKSFAQGLFRESCGGDYFAGVDVTPAYCRHTPPDGCADADALASFVSLSNQLFHKGCWKAASVVKNLVEQHLGDLPLKRKEASYLGWEHYTNAYHFNGYDKNFTPVTRAYTLKSRKGSDPLDGYSALLKHQLSTAVQEDASHLQQSTKRYSVRLRRQRIST